MFLELDSFKLMLGFNYINMEVSILTKNEFESFKIEVLKKIKALFEELKTEMSSKELFTENELCVYLGISKSTIQNYRKDGKIHFIQIKNKIYFRKSDVDTFLDHHSTKNLSL